MADFGDFNSIICRDWISWNDPMGIREAVSLQKYMYCD
jgi:hypothetical protein